MKLIQGTLGPDRESVESFIKTVTFSPTIFFIFGDRELLKKGEWFDPLKKAFPESHILSASSSGEIAGSIVTDGKIVITAVEFEKTVVRIVKESIHDGKESFEIGKKMIASLPTDSLVHCMVFSEGLLINGSKLVDGISEGLPPHVVLTGGLSGDGALFKETVVGVDQLPTSGTIVLIGFYGDSLKVGYGSLGGWDPFGMERVVTKSEHNVLYELDNKPALDLYKRYLGEKAKELPSSGLLFPLSIKIQGEEDQPPVVRTLLGINEEQHSMTFAGDVPEGSHATLMKANFERLIDGADQAAKISNDRLGSNNAELAILISCIGRKLVLGERVQDEVEAVSDVLGTQTVMTGFYSYGEICPGSQTSTQCQLHNQTMTITTFREE